MASAGLSSTVPTTAFLNGDFSALLNTSVVLGRDSAGQTVYGGAIVDPQSGDVFPGNIIPRAAHQRSVAEDRRSLQAVLSAASADADE